MSTNRKIHSQFHTTRSAELSDALSFFDVELVKEKFDIVLYNQPPKVSCPFLVGVSNHPLRLVWNWDGEPSGGPFQVFKNTPNQIPVTASPLKGPSDCCMVVYYKEEKILAPKDYPSYWNF